MDIVAPVAMAAGRALIKHLAGAVQLVLIAQVGLVFATTSRISAYEANGFPAVAPGTTTISSS